MTLQIAGTTDSLTVRVGRFAVVWWTAEGKAAVPTLDVIAGLSYRAVMGPCGTLINISARASIWRHGVAIFRTSTVVTARDIYTPVGAEVADASGTLINVFTSLTVFPEVVALSTVALVGTVDVGTLLTTWAGQTFIHIFTALAIAG